MGILWLFDTCGLMVGPAIWAAGLFALWRCLRASRRTSPPRSRRVAALLSLLPFAVGICGAIFGLILWQVTAQPARNPQDVWGNLGKVCLAGLVVTSLPLLWSLILLRQRRDMALPE